MMINGQYLDDEQVKEIGRAVSSKRTTRRNQKRHTLGKYDMKDLAAACNLHLRTLQYYLKEHHIKIKTLSLLDLVNLINDLRK